MDLLNVLMINKKRLSNCDKFDDVWLIFFHGFGGQLVLNDDIAFDLLNLWGMFEP